MTQLNAGTSTTEAASIDYQANCVPTPYIVGFVITVLTVTWASIVLAAAAGVTIGLYDAWHGIVFSNLTMLIPITAAVVFNTVQRKPARVQLRPLTRHVTAKSVIFAVAFPLALVLGGAALCLVTGVGTLNAGALGASFSSRLFFILIVATAMLFPFALGEEYGWRAYLLPALTVKHGMTRAAALVGVVWAFWHLALFTYAALAVSASPLDAGIQVGLNMASAFALSFPFAYCYFLSGNVLPCALFHAILDNFLILMLASGGLVSSGNTVLFMCILLFVLIPVFIWQFHRMETPWWLPNGTARQYTMPAESA
ncbi:MAG TPA: CPBP family intramembrane glutamic endopeptidase [Candidatus Bathyarchaeia archaeon]|nr:CPBP family intramembrane glutamic endopeptidase [Candidatus Bathyarchaeia archaeon]